MIVVSEIRAIGNEILHHIAHIRTKRIQKGVQSSGYAFSELINNSGPIQQQIVLIASTIFWCTWRNDVKKYGSAEVSGHDTGYLMLLQD